MARRGRQQRLLLLQGCLVLAVACWGSMPAAAAAVPTTTSVGAAITAAAEGASTRELAGNLVGGTGSSSNRRLLASAAGSGSGRGLASADAADATDGRLTDWVSGVAKALQQRAGAIAVMAPAPAPAFAPIAPNERRPTTTNAIAWARALELVNRGGGGGGGGAAVVAADSPRSERERAPMRGPRRARQQQMQQQQQLEEEAEAELLQQQPPQPQPQPQPQEGVIAPPAIYSPMDPNNPQQPLPVQPGRAPDAPPVEQPVVPTAAPSGAPYCIPRAARFAVLAAGDSITQGSVPSANTNHPYTIRLQRLLRSALPGSTVVADDAGLGGGGIFMTGFSNPVTFAPFLADALRQEPRWSVVSLMIGINDLLRGSRPASEIMDGLKPLVQGLLDQGTPVVLIPPLAGPGFVAQSDSKEAERKKLAQMLHDFADQRAASTGGAGPQAWVLDLQAGPMDFYAPALGQWPSDALKKWLDDGLHLTEYGYDQIGRYVFEEIRSHLC